MTISYFIAQFKNLKERILKIYYYISFKSQNHILQQVTRYNTSHNEYLSYKTYYP